MYVKFINDRMLFLPERNVIIAAGTIAEVIEKGSGWLFIRVPVDGDYVQYILSPEDVSFNIHKNYIKTVTNM